MVGFGHATIGLLLARVAAAQTFTNTSTPAAGNNSTETCTYSPSDCAARSSVLSCQALHTSWYSDRNSWTASVTTSSSPAYSYEYSSVIWLGNQSTSLSTLCDGVLRGGKPPAITSTSTTTFYEYFPQYPVPEPTCTYDYNACALLISEYRDAPRGPTASVAPRYPACAWDTEECFNPAGAICPIKVGEVKLIYWPQSKDPSKLCANSTSQLPASITASPTGPPVTTVIGSYTLTSPTVYLSYPYMEALLCWKSFRDIIVPLTNPNDLSSISFVSPAQSSKTMSFNWDDLNSPVPLSAYKGQQSCVSIWNTVRTPFDNCSTVYDDYNPWLVLPTNPLVYTDIDPRFKNCTSIQYSKYVIDPPLALTTAGLLVPEPSSAPSVTSKPEATEPASETASPAPEPAPPTVTATTTQAIPITQPTSDPEDPADAPSDPPADSPADPPTTTGGSGGGLGPIISQIASSAAADQPNNPPADDPAAPPANDNDPSAPASPGTNNDDNDNNNAPPPVVTITPAQPPTSDPGQPSAPSDPSDPSDPSNPANPATDNNSGDPIIIASPANDPANPGAVVIVAGPSDPAGASTTMTLLPGATGVVIPGGTAGSVTVAVPSSGGAVVVGGSETVAVPSAGATAAVGGSGNGDGTGAGEVGAVITGSDGAVVTAVVGTAGGGGGGVGSGSVVVVGGVTVTAGGAAVTVPGVGVVSAVSGGGVVVDGGSTAAFSTIASGSGNGGGGSAVVVTLGGEVETASAGPGGIVVVDGTTLTVGGAAATASDGVVVSAASGGVVVDGTTVPFGSSTSSGTAGATTTEAADASSSPASGTSDGDSAPASSTSSSGAAAPLGDDKMRTVLILLLPLMIFLG